MSFIQYGKQTLEECDLEAVNEVLRENKYLTTGPKVAEFEQAVCQMVGAKYGFAVNSGTAALHCAIRAIKLRPGNEVIVPAITFAASANCVLYEGGIPVFCDIDSKTLNLDPKKVEALITSKTRAIIMVDFAGQTPEYHALRNICDTHHLILIEDAAHTIGHQVPKSVCPRAPHVGSYADLTTYSFHPVKNMTTGEGGMVVTNREDYANRIKTFRTHGISTEYQDRKLHGYDIVELGYNYRLTDFQSALGLSQLRRVKEWIIRRNEIALRYQKAFTGFDLLDPLQDKYGSCYHIYVILLNLEKLDCDRDVIFSELKSRGIGVNVHYRPVYQHTFYQNHSKILSDDGICPVAEDAFSRMITIPLFPTMTDDQIERVINSVKEVVENHRAVSRETI